MSATIQPGTRCGCRSRHAKHLGNGKGASVESPEMQCRRDAVRMVTVVGRGNFVPIPGYERATFHHVPMCRPCADYHERKGV